MNELKNAENKEYISILLEEYTNGLEVNGCDHLSEESLKKFEKNLSIQQSIPKST